MASAVIARNEKASDAEKASNAVLRALRKYRASPFLELAALTGLRREILKRTIESLRAQKIVSVSHPDNVFEQVVLLLKDAPK